MLIRCRVLVMSPNPRIARFDIGRLSSEGGLLVLREIECLCLPIMPSERSAH
jgi:hypothetical protein